MRAFIVGLIFLIGAAVLAAIGILLMPLLLVMAFFLRVLVGAFLILFGIWFLGKLILWILEKFNSNRSKKV